MAWEVSQHIKIISCRDFKLFSNYLINKDPDKISPIRIW